MLNCNTPYIDGYVRKEFTSLEMDVEGYIFGVKSLICHPMYFHFQTKLGAILWNIPISFLVHKQPYELLNKSEEKRLQLLQTWDCQSNSIDTICFKFLENKRVDVFCRDKVWRSGIYIFTIDDYEGSANEINVGYANDVDSKCYHFIALDDGNFCVHPNNLLRWHNADFIIPYPKESPPKIKVFKEKMSSEDIDRTFGNSPYLLYNQLNP